MYIDSNRKTTVDYTTLSPELQDLFREVDQALEDYTESIEKCLRLSRFIIEAADAIDSDMADTRAELAEWV